MSDERQPVILFDPHPRARETIFRPKDWQRLAALGTIVAAPDGARLPAEEVEAHLPEAALVIGQTALPEERLRKAPRLRAILNVEGNFLPNVDYAVCFERGVSVLGVGPAFAQPVAELGLGLAIDAARGITAADRDFRAGRERWGREGNAHAFLLTGAPMGLIGFGHLGRALLPLLRPFRPCLRVHDPWLPAGYLREQGVEPCGLGELLDASRVVFMLAGATDENQAMIGAPEFARMPEGAVFLLMSRAPLVDWEAFDAATRSGRIRGATDVFPQEPAPTDESARDNPNLILSAHRAGAVREAFERIGEMVADDAALILAGLPAVRMQAARRETVGRMRSAPGRGDFGGRK